MKFKNKTTGVILEPSVPMVEEMLNKIPDFAVYEEPSPKKPSEDEKDISERASDSEPSEDAPKTKASSQKKPDSEKKGSKKGE